MPEKMNQERVAPFIGKTIKSIDTSCVNMWTIYFTDDTFFSIEGERFDGGICGMMANTTEHVGQYDKKDKP